MKNKLLKLFICTVLVTLTSCEKENVSQENLNSDLVPNKSAIPVVNLENNKSYDFSYLEKNDKVILRRHHSDSDFTDFIIERVVTDLDEDGLTVRLDTGTQSRQNEFLNLIYNNGTSDEINLSEIDTERFGILPLLALVCCVRIETILPGGGTTITWDCSPCLGQPR